MRFLNWLIGVCLVLLVCCVITLVYASLMIATGHCHGGWLPTDPITAQSKC